jgi:hypothetical protein
MKFGENSERIAIILAKAGVYNNKYDARKQLSNVDKVNIKGLDKSNEEMFIIGKNGHVPWEQGAWVELDELHVGGLIRSFKNIQISVDEETGLKTHTVTQISMEVIDLNRIKHVGNITAFLDLNERIMSFVEIIPDKKLLLTMTKKSIRGALKAYGYLVMHTITLLNEKAVTIDEEAEHRTSSDTAIAAEPFIKYKEVNILLPKPARKRAVGTGKGKPKPRHERQNKPRDYTKGKGCFGKWNVVTKPDPEKSTYWVGSEEVGTIVHTGYNIIRKEGVSNEMQSGVI